MANKRFIDFPIATTVGDNDIILIWQSGANKQTTKATILSGVPDSLNDLTDVTISGLTNGQILRYDSVSGQWENTDQGNLDLNDLNDVTIVSPTNGQVLVYNSSTSKWENSSGGYVPYVGAVTTVNLGAQTIQAGSFVKQGGTASQFLKADGSVDSTAYGTGSVTSVGLTMPAAFNVANSPITTAGTLAVTGAGTVAQYIRGDGSLADFPESSGGGSSVSYYLNGSVAQGNIGGIAYNELSKVPILGAGTDFTINADGYIASFITDAGDPNLLEIPGGNWNFETYFSASSGGGSPTFYVELYKVNAGGTATLIASSSTSPELIAFGTNLTPYFSSLAVPTTTLALTDRLAVRYYVTHSGRTITLHTENNHLCQIITTFTTGLTALNGLTAQVQNFAVGTTGTDFNIASAVSTHTFNLPTASATNRGALSSADWSMFNSKQNALTLTTTGTSGAATLVGDTLNIPNYGSALAGYLPLTGGTLTGPLNGTSANFSSDVKARGYTFNAFSGGGEWQFGSDSVTGNGLFLYQTAYGYSFTLSSNGNGIFAGAVTANSFIKSGGTSSQFLKADGSVDSTSYLPLTGGTLTGPLGVTGNVTLISGGFGSSFDRQISLGSGTAYSYQAKANGDDFQLIEAGSHVFLEYDYGGSLGTGTIRLYNNTVSTGSFTANSFTKIGGTSSQYLMADGSVSTLTNPVTGSGNSGTIPVFTGSTTIGNSIIQSNSTQVNIVGNGSQLLFDSLSSSKSGGIQYINDFELSIFNSRGTGSSIYLGSTNLDFNTNSSGNPKLRITQTGAATFSSSVTASSFIRSGGTSSQFLKADGSVDSTSYVSSVTASSPLASSGGTTPNITIQQASGSQSGFLSSTDWTTFNSKQNTLTLTTTGSTGAATLVGSTLNIPNYGSGLSGYLPLTGGTLTGPLGGTSGNFSSSVNANKFFVNTSGQSREISTFHETGSTGQNIWIGGGGLNSTTGGGASLLGSLNTSLGVVALQSNTTGSNNTAIGYISLYLNNTGYSNTAAGSFSMQLNTSGYINSAFGALSLISNTTGYANSAFGCDALRYITTGRENTGIGFQAGAYINTGATNLTSENSVYIGSDTRASASGNTNEIVIGFGGRGQGSNSAVIGNSSITKTILNGNVLIGTTTDFGVRLAIGGNIIMPNGANREIYMGSATNYNYRIRSTGDDFIINEANSVDRLKYVYADTRWYITGGLTISGSLSKGSGSFKIDHPLPEKKETHHLVHSFIEGPQADNIYRGKIDLIDGYAEVNIDESAKMSNGTFVLLNGNIQCYTSNETGWTSITGKVEGNILKIKAQDLKCTDTISWLVIGERIDQHMKDTDWTDENGKVIVEPQKK